MGAVRVSPAGSATGVSACANAIAPDTKKIKLLITSISDLFFGNFLRLGVGVFKHFTDGFLHGMLHGILD